MPILPVSEARPINLNKRGQNRGIGGRKQDHNSQLWSETVGKHPQAPETTRRGVEQQDVK